MYPGGYTAEVTSLSPKATEQDVYDFFSHCGAVEHVEVIRYRILLPLLLITDNDSIVLFFILH